MNVRVIVSLFTSVFLAFGAVQPSLAANASNNAQADAVITDMAQAFKRGDRKRGRGGSRGLKLRKRERLALQLVPCNP